MALSSPCYDCKKRFIGCHSSCEDYISYKEGMNNLKEKGKSGIEIDSYLITKTIKSKDKYAERKKNRRARRYKR